MKLLKNLFGMGTADTFKALTGLVDETFTSKEEKAEIKIQLLKAVDPNGQMRRQISGIVGVTWLFYNIALFVLVLCEAFALSPEVMHNGQMTLAVSIAVQRIADLYLPVTTLFGSIVGVSFGVNGINAWQKK